MSTRRAVVVCLAVALLGASATPAPLYPKTNGRFGYGIFQVMHWHHLEGQLTANIENPYLAGVKFFVCWSELEPQQGRFDWTAIDRVIEPWAKHGDKVILGIKTAQDGAHDEATQSCTPPWVFEKSKPLPGADDTQPERQLSAKREEKRAARGKGREGKGKLPVSWPVYWDPAYLDAYGKFVQAVARRYDGHPALESVQVGAGKLGTTKVAGKPRDVERYRTAGYSPEAWTRTVKSIMDMYLREFKKTPLALTLQIFEKGREEDYHFLDELAAYAAAHQVQIHHVGAYGTDKFKQQPFAAMFGKYSAQTKVGFSADNPITIDTARNQQKYGDTLPLVRNVVGGQDGTSRTNISYMMFYVRDIAAGTRGTREYDKEFEAALEFIYKNLRK